MKCGWWEDLSSPAALLTGAVPGSPRTPPLAPPPPQQYPACAAAAPLALLTSQFASQGQANKIGSLRDKLSKTHGALLWGAQQAGFSA